MQKAGVPHWVTEKLKKRLQTGQFTGSCAKEIKAQKHDKTRKLVLSSWYGLTVSFYHLLWTAPNIGSTDRGEIQI